MLFLHGLIVALKEVGELMESIVVGKIVRDGEDLLLVFSNDVVAKFDLKEGDDWIPISVERGKLNLELVRTAE